MREKILIIIPTKINLIEVTRQQILECFLKESSPLYPHACDEVLRELDNIVCIQVYNDNVTRLHLKPKNHFSPKTSIIIEESMYGETLIEILDNLVS